ncbi:MAG: TspO/MBR family protein [Gammaproteobacteria bacterium]
MTRSITALLVFLACAFGAASTGYFFPPGDWYAGIEKPFFNPPAWIFGPVWTALYAMMSVAAWLAWKQAGWRSRPITLWFGQIALNALWTPLFFGLHWLGVAMLELAALWVLILLTLLAFRQVSRPAAWLMAPYLAWVSFAWVLNLSLWRLN